jgi:GNAT superfamily N-acetyltransferase
LSVGQLFKYSPVLKSIIISHREKEYSLKLLDKDDSEALSRFFFRLSDETRSRFGPHPLDEQYAGRLCAASGTEIAERFVLNIQDMIIGYFIIDPEIPGHEAHRYTSYSIELKSMLDCMFAPCLADDYQSKGLGAKVMPYLVEHCRRKGYRSLVLLGGTQETNEGALHFYRKFGFRTYGGYHTSVFNLDMRLEL